MPNERHSASFSIDGYEVSATFADAGNLTATAMQNRSYFLLLLPVPPAPKASLQYPRNRGIIMVGVILMYLENCISPVY